MTVIKVFYPDVETVKTVLDGINSTIIPSELGIIIRVDSYELSILLGIDAKIGYSLWMLKQTLNNSLAFRPNIILIEPITKNEFSHMIKNFIIADQAKSLCDEIA